MARYQQELEFGAAPVDDLFRDLTWMLKIICNYAKFENL